MIGPYEFPPKFVWTNGAQSFLKVSVLTGIGPYQGELKVTELRWQRPPKTQIFAENRWFSQIRPFSWKYQHLEGAGNRRKPLIFAENRRFSQKTAGNRRLGSVTLGASPSARPYHRVLFLETCSNQKLFARQPARLLQKQVTALVPRNRTLPQHSRARLSNQDCSCHICAWHNSAGT